MPTATHQLWWIFVAASLVGLILTAAFVTSVVVQQRRFLATTREFSGRLLAAQEEERAWVARELHDDIIQRVAVLGHELERLEGPAPLGGAEWTRQLHGLRDELHDLAEEIRRLAHRMHPSILDHLGLSAALFALAGEIGASGVEVSVESRLGADPVPAAVATCLYRVAQEALRNVAKHAASKHATLRLHSEAGGLALEIEDRGAGFDLTRPAVSAGLGLTSLAERVRLLDGRLTVKSRVGHGTRVAAWVPLVDQRG